MVSPVELEPKSEVVLTTPMSRRNFLDVSCLILSRVNDWSTSRRILQTDSPNSSVLLSQWEFTECYHEETHSVWACYGFREAGWNKPVAGFLWVTNHQRKNLQLLRLTSFSSSFKSFSCLPALFSQTISYSGLPDGWGLLSLLWPVGGRLKPELFSAVPEGAPWLKGAVI